MSTNTSYIEKVKRIGSSGFVGYWPLNEERGTTVFNAVIPAVWGTTTPESNGVSAALVRKADHRAFRGPDGGVCAQFDGTSSVVDMVSALSSSTSAAGTMAIWAAVPEANLAGTTKMVLFHFAVDGNYQIQLKFDTSAQQFTAMHDANSEKTSTGSVYNVDGGDQWPEWHHFAMTYADSGTMQFYVDGVAQTAATSLGAWSGTFAGDLMVLGSDHSTPSDQFTGYLAHFAWWNHALSADDVKDLATIGP